MRPMLLALLLALSSAALADVTPALAQFAGDRSDAPRKSLRPVQPPAGMRADDDDRVRAPRPGVVAPTDPRDGIRREPRLDTEEILDPRVQEFLARQTLNGYEEVGGDDVVFGALRYIDRVEMDIDSSGAIYIALGRSTSSPSDEFIEIYRSLDGGDTFDQIGLLQTPGDDDERLYDLNIVEGNVDRVYVTYMFFDDSQVGFDMRVAYADLGAVTPVWTVRTVMDVPGVSFLGPDLADDSKAFGDYYLYAVCAGLDGNGDDIWFSRSTDYGNSWSAPYRMASITSSGNLMYSRPRVTYGGGGEVHVAWEYTERLQSTFDASIRYRKAVNYGATLADWSVSQWALTPTNDGVDHFVRGIETDLLGDRVAVLYATYSGTSPNLFASLDSGDSWSLTNVHEVPMPTVRETHWDAAGERLLIAGAIHSGLSSGWRSAFCTVPFTDLSDFSDPRYFAEYSAYSSGWPSIAIDPTRTPGVAFAYSANTNNPDYQAAFDAEWRAGPGYPNYEPGFPVDIPGGGSAQRTSPALVDLDDDGDLEIVFGNVNGEIYVVEHDGSIAPGWPIDVGALADRRAAVAVGDLNGDGVMSIVAGTADGRVFAFAPDGTPVGGFPVDLGTGAATYVSIGAVGPPYPRWIVAGSGNKTARINWRGAVEFKSGTLTGVHVAPAAIGDVDDDGDAEVVYAFAPATGGGFVHVINGDFTGGTQSFRSLPETVSNAVSLGDLDLDGTLEVVVPTSTGKLYVLSHTLADMPGFPFVDPTGTPLTRVAIDQMLGTSQPELIFAARNYNVHVVYSTGVAQSNYPASTTPGWFLHGGPIVTSVNSEFGNFVVMGSRDQRMWSFRNVGGLPADGWPKLTSDYFETTPAAADIDGDGRNEIVFLGNSQLHVVDVAVSSTAANEWWRMDGADHQRTGCANCAEDIVTAVGDESGLPTRVSLRIASGNPSNGPVAFAFALPSRGIAELEVFDVRGRRVRLVQRSEYGAGEHQLLFDGRDGEGQSLARGTYFAQLVVRSDSGTQKTSRKFTWLD